ncbi:EamA family transporter RarD [bacterium]|nr:EamA family transporter RarD [bacterium]
MKKGIWLAAGAYLLWGFLPLFWKQIHHLPPQEILGHRIAWSFIFLCALIRYKKQWTAFRPRLLITGTKRTYLATGIILAGNWFTFIWAVNNGYLVEASLGYFLNPLITILLGVIFLKESLRKGQWIAMALVLAGILIPTLHYGRIPWVALILAFSFAFYGLIKKTGPLESIESMATETGWLFLPGIILLSVLQIQGKAAIGNAPLSDHILLILTGLATTAPLLLFTAAARLIPLSKIGMMQYLAPTIQFLLGILVYGESFSNAQAVGFGLVWAAIIFYMIEGLYVKHKTQRLCTEST